MFMYKLNFLNLNENNWHGSKICLKKNLKSPQWLRDLKFKKYPFWSLDKPKIFKLLKMVVGIFAYLQKLKIFQKKIKIFCTWRI